MKIIIIIIISSVISLNTEIILGQMKYEPLKKECIILKDTLWVKQNLWKLSSFYGFKIDSIEANKTNFSCIPVYKLNKEVLKYCYGMAFSKILTIDSTKVSGFFLIKNEAIGFLSGFRKHDKWISEPIEFFSDQSPLKNAYNLLTKNEINSVFLVRPIGFGSICYNVGDQTFIYDPYQREFVHIEGFIKERVTIQTLINIFNSNTEK